MRKNQISLLANADLGPVYSSFRWGSALAGLCVALLVFSALAILVAGLSAASMNTPLLQMPPFPKVATAHKWILFWITVSGAAALFTGSFLAARSSGPITARVGRMEGLVITSLFLPIALVLCHFAGSISPQYLSISDSLDLKYTNVATNLESQPIIGRQLQGLRLNAPEPRVTEGIMKRITRNNMPAAYTYLSNRAGISEAEARRRLDPVRNEVLAAFPVASGISAYLTRLVSFLAFAAIALGAGAAMAGGTVGARMNQRAPLSVGDREAIEETAAA